MPFRNIWDLIQGRNRTVVPIVQSPSLIHMAYLGMWEYIQERNHLNAFSALSPSYKRATFSDTWECIQVKNLTAAPNVQNPIPNQMTCRDIPSQFIHRSENFLTLLLYKNVFVCRCFFLQTDIIIFNNNNMLYPHYVTLAHYLLLPLCFKSTCPLLFLPT